MSWRLHRLRVVLRANHLKLPLIKLRFWLKKPRLRLVLSTHFYGGVGDAGKTGPSGISMLANDRNDRLPNAKRFDKSGGMLMHELIFDAEWENNSRSLCFL